MAELRGDANVTGRMAEILKEIGNAPKTAANLNLAQMRLLNRQDSTAEPFDMAARMEDMANSREATPRTQQGRRTVSTGGTAQPASPTPASAVSPAPAASPAPVVAAPPASNAPPEGRTPTSPETTVGIGSEAPNKMETYGQRIQRTLGLSSGDDAAPTENPMMTAAQRMGLTLGLPRTERHMPREATAGDSSQLQQLADADIEANLPIPAVTANGPQQGPPQAMPTRTRPAAAEPPDSEDMPQTPNPDGNPNARAEFNGIASPEMLATLASGRADPSMSPADALGFGRLAYSGLRAGAGMAGRGIERLTQALAKPPTPSMAGTVRPVSNPINYTPGPPVAPNVGVPTPRLPPSSPHVEIVPPSVRPPAAPSPARAEASPEVISEELRRLLGARNPPAPSTPVLPQARPQGNIPINSGAPPTSATPRPAPAGPPRGEIDPNRIFRDEVNQLSRVNQANRTGQDARNSMAARAGRADEAANGSVYDRMVRAGKPIPSNERTTIARGKDTRRRGMRSRNDE